MLNIKRSITLMGSSVINGEQAEGYQAVIDSSNPEDMTISSWQVNKALYKANRVDCRKDAADFEDAAYELQDSLIAETTSVHDEA